MNDAKLCYNMRVVSLKKAQIALQKKFIYTKKSGKDKHKWEVVWVEIGLPLRKLGTI
jgi:hypothetical protein